MAGRLTFVLLTTGCWLPVAMAQEADPKVTELYEPVPAAVAPAADPGNPPADAIVLFDGSSLAAWEHVDGSVPAWPVAGGIVTAPVDGMDIRTRQKFGDVQLHVEWQSPPPDVHRRNLASPHGVDIVARFTELGIGQYMANSGVFLQERYEVQVLENYDESTYVNGQAGAIYKQHVPLADARRSPGEWQVYDIVFRAPRFNDNGGLAIPARMTVFMNGVLIHDNVTLAGPVAFIGLPRYEAHGDASLRLQSHLGVSEISYRNIWIREL